MKTSILADGKLTIKAENDIEQYALKKWWTDYQENTAILEVQFNEELPHVLKNFCDDCGLPVVKKEGCNKWEHVDKSQDLTHQAKAKYR